MLAAMDGPSREIDHIFLVFRPRLMTSLWVKGSAPLTRSPCSGFFAIGGKTKKPESPSTLPKRPSLGRRTKTWLCLRDLTVDMEALTASLEETP